MQNIPSELIINVKNYINITSFKMKGSPDLGQAVYASMKTQNWTPLQRMGVDLPLQPISTL